MSSQPSQPASDEEVQEMGPTQMMMSTPAPVLHLLTRMSPHLTHLTAGVNVMLWKSTLTPFTLIVLWWGICLFGIELARYGINAVLLIALGVGWIRSRATAKAPIPSSKMDPVRYAKTLDEARALDSALADLSEYVQPIIDLVYWRDPHASLSATSYLLTSYPFVLALTIFVPLPHLFGSLGTLIICWNAPWFALVRRSLGKSLVMRWVGRFLLGIIGGGRGVRREIKRGRRGFALLRSTLTASAAPPSFVPQTAGKASMATAEGDYADNLHYTFTVYENQRWWVGLDWTQALLPNERPSWSDAHHAPVSPPTSFLLPAAATNMGSLPGDNKHKLRRTTEWRWVDDWTVRKATAPVDTTSSQNAPQGKSRGSFSEWTARLSSPTRRKELETPSSPTSNDVGENAKKQSLRDDAIADDKDGNGPQGTDEEPDSDWDCDEQGWQYGDNAWAPLSSKGKIGRYTRRRAWQRTAVVIENEEKVPANVDTGSAKTAVPTSKASGSTEISSKDLRQRRVAESQDE